MWLSLVERLVWDQDAAGSNPVIPTITNPHCIRPCGLFIFILKSLKIKNVQDLFKNIIKTNKKISKYTTILKSSRFINNSRKLNIKQKIRWNP